MKPILFLAAAIVLVATGLGIRAHNHSQAVDRASIVVAADRAGNPTQNDITLLKSYVKSHTGSTVMFSLGGSFSRAQAAAEASAKAQGGTGQLYVEGQQKCAGKADSITQARCVQQYVSAHLANVAVPVAVAPPNPKDYMMTVMAPKVAFDLASLTFFIAFCFSLVGAYYLIRKQRNFA